MKKALALIACLLVACAVFADGVGLMGGIGGLTVNYKQDNSNITYKLATNFANVVVGMDMDMGEYPLFTVADIPVNWYWGVGGDVGMDFLLNVYVDAGAYAGLRMRFLDKWEIFAPQLGLKPQLQLHLSNLDSDPVSFVLFNVVGEAGFRYWF